MISFHSNGQTRAITGKVLDEELGFMPAVRIQTRDTVQLGTTDKDGNFKIEIPQSADHLLLSWIGMEWATIKLPDNCGHLEIIMLNDVIYDYVSRGTINRRRYKRFKDLPNKHLKAHEKGLFKFDTPCITYIFKKY